MNAPKCTSTRSFSPTEARAREILARIFALLDEAEMAKRIDIPLEKATLTFKCPPGAPASVTQLHRIIGRFLKHVSRSVGSRAGVLPPQRVYDEAVTSLRQAFGDTPADSYDAALREAFDASQSGIRVAVERVALMLKHRNRSDYVRWVFARHIDPADWELRLAIADALVERIQHALPQPPTDYEYHPELLADHLPDLLQRVLEVFAACGRQFTRNRQDALKPHL